MPVITKNRTSKIIEPRLALASDAGFKVYQSNKRSVGEFYHENSWKRLYC